MFELTLAEECKVSFGQDGLDASKGCHISAKRNVSGRATGYGSQACLAPPS